MKPALAELLHHPLLWRGDRLARVDDAVASGFASLDHELPGGGWPKAGLTELLVDAEGIGELSLLLLVGVQGWRDPIGQQSLETSEESPLAENFWILQEIGNVGFVVSLEANHLVASASRDQHIQHVARLQSAVDIITEQHLDDSRCWKGCHVRVYAGEEPSQKVSATVHVTDRVDAHTVCSFRGCFFGARQQRIPHRSLTPVFRL